MGLFTIALVLIAISCTDKTTEVKKEVIVVPAKTTAPAVIIKADPPKTTSIVVDKNGMKVETKKVNVKVGQ